MKNLSGYTTDLMDENLLPGRYLDHLLEIHDFTPSKASRCVGKGESYVGKGSISMRVLLGIIYWFFGHTPTAHYQRSIPMEPWYGDKCIGFDCGCGYPEIGSYKQHGRLACLCLDTGKAFYSDESKPLKCYA